MRKLVIARLLALAAGTRVALEVIDGLDHPQEFEQIDRVFAREIEFTRSHR